MSESATFTESQTPVNTGHSSEPSFFSAEASLLLLTWLTFFVLLAILSKFAFKPILMALENRESAIRKSVDEAEKIKLELAKIQQNRDEVLQKAEAKAKALIDEARSAAIDAAKIIEQNTQKQNKEMIDNAQKEIFALVENAKQELKKEGVDLAVKLAGKLIEENLDASKNRKIIDQFIEKI